MRRQRAFVGETVLGCSFIRCSDLGLALCFCAFPGSAHVIADLGVVGEISVWCTHSTFRETRWCICVVWVVRNGRAMARGRWLRAMVSQTNVDRLWRESWILAGAFLDFSWLLCEPEC